MKKEVISGLIILGLTVFTFVLTWFLIVFLHDDLNLCSIDKPVKIDLSEVEWLDGFGFKELGLYKISGLFITDGESEFEDCEIDVELPGKYCFPEFVELLNAISRSHKSKEGFPVGGGKFWFVLENNYGLFLDVCDTGSAVLMKDGFGEIRESEELLKVVERLREMVGVKAEIPPTFEVPEGGF